MNGICTYVGYEFRTDIVYGVEHLEATFCNKTRCGGFLRNDGIDFCCFCCSECGFRCLDDSPIDFILFTIH